MTKTRGNHNQPQRFVEAACEAGADIDTSAADALMGKLAKTPPEPKAVPKPPKPSGKRS